MAWQLGLQPVRRLLACPRSAVLLLWSLPSLVLLWLCRRAAPRATRCWQWSRPQPSGAAPWLAVWFALLLEVRSPLGGSLLHASHEFFSVVVDSTVLVACASCGGYATGPRAPLLGLPFAGAVRRPGYRTSRLRRMRLGQWPTLELERSCSSGLGGLGVVGPTFRCLVFAEGQFAGVVRCLDVVL